MVIALALAIAALVAVSIVAYRLQRKLKDKAPPVGGAAAVFAAWRDSGQMSAEDANVAMVALREAKRRARKAGR